MRESVFLALQTKDDSCAILTTNRHGLIHPLGGKVEADETVMEALLREVKEEFTSINEFQDRIRVHHQTCATYSDGTKWGETYYKLALTTWEFTCLWDRFLSQCEYSKTVKRRFTPATYRLPESREGGPRVSWWSGRDVQTTICTFSGSGEQVRAILGRRTPPGRKVADASVTMLEGKLDILEWPIYEWVQKEAL